MVKREGQKTYCPNHATEEIKKKYSTVQIMSRKDQGETSTKASKSRAGEQVHGEGPAKLTGAEKRKTKPSSQELNASFSQVRSTIICSAASKGQSQ